MESICIFCGSKSGLDTIYTKSAIKLGEILAKRNIRLIYGGASTGIMGALAKSVVENGGNVTGVMARETLSKELPNTKVSKLILVDSLSERKQTMLLLSEAVIALPGGIGTLEEFSEMFTLRLLSLHHKPCGLLNTNKYYDPFISFIDNSIKEGFMSKKYRSLLIVKDDPISLLDEIAQ